MTTIHRKKGVKPTLETLYQMYLRHFTVSIVVLLPSFESCSHEETVRITNLLPGWWTTTFY